tara:strand:- start:138 stop:284 length:147 start_codon:yes stop_codon:yes gene_type:complete
MKQSITIFIIVFFLIYGVKAIFGVINFGNHLKDINTEKQQQIDRMLNQ